MCSRIVALASFLVLAAVPLACSDHDPSPYGPYVGDAGLLCDSDRDCRSGHCCKKKECGDMCTYECKNDLDCPVGMGCEHDVCLFACRSDAECARGQRCEHNVCEF